jgi:hypothetical protein
VGVSCTFSSLDHSSNGNVRSPNGGSGCPTRSTRLQGCFAATPVYTNALRDWIHHPNKNFKKGAGSGAMVPKRYRCLFFMLN